MNELKNVALKTPQLSKQVKIVSLNNPNISQKFNLSKKVSLISIRSIFPKNLSVLVNGFKSSEIEIEIRCLANDRFRGRVSFLFF